VVKGIPTSAKPKPEIVCPNAAKKKIAITTIVEAGKPNIGATSLCRFASIIGDLLQIV
jgi:hypothetical protein